MKEKANIDKIYTRSKKAITPTLLKFQNGKLAAISKEKTRFSLIERQKDHCKGALVVANDNVYHGMFGNSETEELTDSYICVRNRSTNRIRIIPIEKVLLNNDVYRKLEITHSKLTEENAKKLLLKQFGGRKASRYVYNQENMKMNVDVVKDDLDKTIQESSFSTEDSDKLESEKFLEDIRPKCNSEAVKIHEVYKVGDIVAEDLLVRLEEEAKVVFSTSVEKLPIASEYLRSCIEKIQKATPSAEGFQHIKLIIFMDCLLHLIKSRARSLKTIELSAITEKVENYVRDHFSDPNSKSFTKTTYSSEKALCYFIVLALLISDNYEVDANVLAQELCTPKKKIVKFAHIVNALPKSKSDILTLRLPSTMKPLRSNFSRKSKK